MLSFIMRTFALSLSIFWRALPAWVVLFSVLYAIGSFFSESPIIFILLLSLAAGTLMFFMVFVHIRQGLVAMGEVAPTDLGMLFKRSFKFFRFFASFNGLVGGLSMVAAYTAAQLGVFDMAIVEDALIYGDPEATEELVNMLSSPAVYAYFTITQILSQLAYCALAVPVAANAAACSVKSRDTEVFWGFGAHTFRMFLLNLISGTVVTGMVIVYFLVVLTMPIFDGASMLQVENFAQVAMPSTTSQFIMLGILVAMPVVGVVWLVSLWCAGATLCYIQHRDKVQVERDFEMARVYEKPASVEDLRALRMARMQPMNHA